MAVQKFSTNIFRAILSALSGEAASVNVKDMIVTLNLLMQLAPPSQWGEAMHISGLFTHLMKTVMDAEV